MCVILAIAVFVRYRPALLPPSALSALSIDAETKIGRPPHRSKKTALVSDSNEASKVSSPGFSSTSTALGVGRQPGTESETEDHIEEESAAVSTLKLIPASPTDLPTSASSEQPAGLLGRGGAVTSGHVHLVGTSPPEKVIDMSADASCKARHPVPATARLSVVNTEGGLADVFVYVKRGVAVPPVSPPDKPVVLDQRNCMCVPHLFGVQVNQSLKIVNSDDMLHNVHTTAVINAELNRGQPVKGTKFTHGFTTREVMVKFKCVAHPRDELLRH